MDLSIIIVNWKSIEFIKACLASLQATANGVHHEVLVVDNASEPELCRTLPETFSGVRVICSEHNIGFSRANNLGAQQSRGRGILFLNPDTLVLEGAIEKMLFQLQSDVKLGAVGCRLLNADRSLQTTSVMPFPTITNQVLGVEWLQQRWPNLRMWGMRALYAEQRGVHEVEVVSGACLMMKRDVFERVGGFSTDYFMYAEDTDLCYKVWQAGWKVGYVADAQIVHFGGQSSSSKENGFADIVMRESMFRMLAKFRGFWYAALYRAAMLLSAMLRLTLLFPLMIVPVVDLAGVLRTCRKWKRIAAWTLGFEGWARQLTHSTARTTALAGH